ncbi:MAG TPA: glycosyltransferase family 39 protein [Anaerolineae bacterium]|nr:glycosyltransferase family 39 protein [Anaerolineae bacterium]
MSHDSALSPFQGEGRREGPVAPVARFLLWALALAGLALLAGFTLWFCARALRYPYQLLYGEGFMLEFARRLLAGEPIYKPLADLPLGTVNYPPLPFLLARVTFPIFGFGYAAGRIWAVLAALGVAALLFAWVRRATGRTAPASAVALAWLGAPYVYNWAPQFRVDLPGLAFGLAGLYLVWRALARADIRTRDLAPAALLFVLGLYCKQSFIAAPAAALLALFLARRHRQALLFALLILLLGGIPFLILNKATAGAFWNSLVAANVNPFQPDRLLAQAWDFSRTYPVLLLLSGVWLVGRRAFRRSRPSGRAGTPPAEGLVAAYLALALLAVALAGKAGSWENYFLEPLAAVCLASGLALPKLGRRPAGRWAAPLLLLLQVALMWHTPAPAARQMLATAAANEVLSPVVASAPGQVLSEDAGLLVQAGKPVPYYDFQLSQLARAGRWDQAWEVESLRAGAFSLVIFEGDSRIEADKYGRYTRAFMSALDYGYRLSGRAGKYTLYRPAPLARERQASFVGGPRLVGHTLPPVEVQPGQLLSLDVVWEAEEPMPQAYTSFLHLLDKAGQRQAGDDRQPWEGLYPTTLWAAGEMVRMSYTLTLPVDLPAGLYTLSAGWYDRSVTRLRTEEGADLAPLAVVVVPSSPGPSLPADVGASFDNAIRLAQFQLVRVPGGLTLTLGWEADRLLDEDLTVFVHLRDALGATVSQGDGPPLGGAWPTSLWPTGYLIEDPHSVPIPAGLEAGQYTLAVGLYDPRTQRRVPLLSGGDELMLQRVDLP